MLDAATRCAFNAEHAMFRDSARKVFATALSPNLDECGHDGSVGRSIRGTGQTMGTRVVLALEQGGTGVRLKRLPGSNARGINLTSQAG